MFSSLRTRLWLSYAVLIVTALGVVAFVLILYLLRNPVLYRQTFVQLRAADNLLNQPNSNTDFIAQALNVRVLTFNSTGTLIDGY